MNEKKVLYTIFSYTKKYGGGEKYIELLTEELSRRKLKYNLLGSGALGEKNLFKKSDFSNNISILNGNRALYRNTLFNNSFKVYIQHSNINDNQGFLFKIYIRRLLFKYLLKKVDLIVRVSELSIDNSITPTPIVTIKNGVKINNSKNFNSLTISKKIKLLMVGSVNENKNQKLAIEMLSEIPNSHLTIVGTGNEKYVDYLKKLAITLGVNSRICWVGFTKNVNQFYLDADLLLLLSKNEACPFCVLEAMSFGLPVLSVKITGIESIIQSRKDGWILNTYDVDELVNQVELIHMDIEKYISVSKLARLKIFNYFSSEKMVDKLLENIKKTLGDNNEKNRY